MIGLAFANGLHLKYNAKPSEGSGSQVQMLGNVRFSTSVLVASQTALANTYPTNLIKMFSFIEKSW